MALRDWLSDSKHIATAKAANPAKETPETDSVLASLAALAIAGTLKCRSARQKNAWDLPPGCPLLGGQVPDDCRFEARFFERMINEGVLPFDDVGCPLLQVCRLLG